MGKKLTTAQKIKNRSVTNNPFLPRAQEVSKAQRDAKKALHNQEEVEKTRIYKKLDSQDTTLSYIQFAGSGLFRFKILFALLSGKSLKITDIRIDEQRPGLRDYEVNFLHLIDRITHGSFLNINKTGTAVKFTPGVLSGGQIEHDCTLQRSVGYLLEPILILGPFCKEKLQVTLKNCITNSDTDISCDIVRAVTIRQLQHFGFGSYNIIGEKSDAPEIKVIKRGALPLGGGEVFFSVPVMKQLQPCTLIDPGMIRRIRGLAYTTKCSSSFNQRMITSARGVLNGYVADVHIYSDSVTQKDTTGKSPGYAIGLAAESTTGCVLSAQRSAITANIIASDPSLGKQGSSGNSNGGSDSATQTDIIPGDISLLTPEDVGRVASKSLLEEISYGGCVDSYHQAIFLIFMALGPDQQVSRVRFGQLTPQSVYLLRLLKDFWGIQFQLTPDMTSQTVLVSCVGSGFHNMNRKAI